MAKTQHIESLFLHHLNNLRSVCPEVDDIFVCPICFVVFSKEHERLSVGHVWPKSIRNQSEMAKHQQLLLCEDCNWQAGVHGDTMMQELEKLRGGERSGRLYKPRRIQVLPPRESRFVEQPAELSGFVVIRDQNRFSLQFKRGLYDPKEFERFQRYSDQGPCSVIVHSHEVDWRLAQAGWLTSAFLFAFYTFGYRYIFQACLDPVREYIRYSFEKKVDDSLRFDESKDVSVRTCNRHFSTDPEIGFFIPVGAELSRHLEVRFLDYHMRLPLRYIPSVATQMFSDYGELPDDAFLGFKGHIAHAHICQFDILLGETDYWVKKVSVVG